MTLRKTVWVIDVYDYLALLEECLNQLVPKYPWLADRSSIDSRWNWMYSVKASDRERTQRDFLIDWLIRQEIHEMFYLWAENHHRSTDYEIIHHELLTRFDLHTRTVHGIFIPHMYGHGDIHPGRMWRYDCWLYIECEVSESTLEKYAASPLATTRN